MPKNILVIDDDGMVTKSLCSFLAKSGYITDSAETGYEGLEKIKDTHLDLIVIDIRMPGLNGVETAKKIKEILKSKNIPEVPILFITGYTDSKENILAQEIGEVIFKPFNNQDFLECIRKYL